MSPASFPLAVALALAVTAQVAEPMARPVYNCPAGGGQLAAAIQGAVNLLDTASDDIQPLLADVPRATINTLAWSPDGTRIAVETNQSGTWGIYVVEVSEAGAAVAEAQPLFDAPDADESHPVWSPDGTQIAFSSNGSLHVASRDGSVLRDLTADASNLDFLWSTDGANVLFSVTGETGWTVNSVDADTGEVSAVASGEGYAYLYSVSPDNVLLMIAETAEGIGIISIDVTSGELTEMDIRGYGPRWSPDGTRIAYLTEFNESGAEGYKIAVMDPDGTNSVTLSDDFEADVLGEIAWSPDGTRLAFTAARTGYAYEYTVHVLAIDTREIQVFPDAYATSPAPIWRPCTMQE